MDFPHKELSVGENTYRVHALPNRQWAALCEYLADSLGQRTAVALGVETRWALLEAEDHEQADQDGRQYLACPRARLLSPWFHTHARLCKLFAIPSTGLRSSR